VSATIRLNPFCCGMSNHTGTWIRDRTSSTNRPACPNWIMRLLLLRDFREDLAFYNALLTIAAGERGWVLNYGSGPRTGSATELNASVWDKLLLRKPVVTVGTSKRRTIDNMFEWSSGACRLRVLWRMRG